MSKAKKIIGYCGFFFLNRINLRLLFPLVGNPAEDFRQTCLRLIGAHIGKNSFLRPNGKIYFPQNLSVGENSKIGNDYNIFLYEKLTIGDNVEIGPELLVYTGEHNFGYTDQPLTKQGAHHKPVTISNDVYIGARVTILKGTVINNRVIVAAGAVVSGSLESGYIYGGVPAQKIKPIPDDRNKKD